MSKLSATVGCAIAVALLSANARMPRGFAMPAHGFSSREHTQWAAAAASNGLEPSDAETVGLGAAVTPRHAASEHEQAARRLVRTALLQGNESFWKTPSAVFLSEDPTGWGVMCSGILVRDSVVLTAGRCIGSVSTGTEAAARVPAMTAKVYVGAGAPGSFELLHAADTVSGVYLWAPGMPGSNIGLAQIEWRAEAANDSRVVAARGNIVPLLSSVVNTTTSFPPPLPGQSPRPLPSLQPGGDEEGSGPSAEELDRLTRVGFPFASTLVGYGAAQGQEGTVGVQRFVHRTGSLLVTNRSYVTLRTLGCRNTIRGGSWLGEGANTTDGAQACIAGGDLGAPLLAEFGGSEYIVGIAERGDNSPCSNTRTWFTSVLFRAEFLSRELQLIDSGIIEACPSASPTPTATGTPTPTGTATPTSSPSPSTIVVAVVPSPPPPPPEPFPLALVLAIVLAVVLLALLMMLLWAILMCSERHRRVRPTTFDMLVVARPEDRRLVQEKRTEMKEVAAHQGEHHAAECEQCRKFQEEKERRRAMVEAGLEEATPSSSEAGSEAGDDAAPAAEEEVASSPASDADDAPPPAGLLQAPQHLPDDPVMQAQLLRASGSVAVVVDRTAGTVFLPDTFLAGKSDSEEAQEAAAPSRLRSRPAAGPAASQLPPTAPSALLEEAEDGSLRLVYAGPHDALPVRADNDPRAIRHIVPHHLLRSLTALDESPSAQYLGRATDLAQLRKALGDSEWAAAAARAESMLRRQAVLQARLGDESRAATARASAAASSRAAPAGARA